MKYIILSIIFITLSGCSSNPSFIPTHSVGCVSLDKLNNSHTPVDIYPGYAECVIENNIDDSARLFMLAGAYGRYDIYRVTDRSAHQSVRVLLMMAREEVKRDLNEETITTYTKKLKERLQGNKEFKDNLCTQIFEFGHPEYHPAYMIQHGINAAINALNMTNNSSINTDIDPDSLWKQAVTDYMRCTNL